MREYDVIRKSDNKIIDLIFGYSESDAFARSGYDSKNYILVGGWYAN